MNKDQIRLLALDDLKRHELYGVDRNPFSTHGARNDWDKGYQGLLPYGWFSTEEPQCPYWERGRQAKIIDEEIALGKEQK